MFARYVLKILQQNRWRDAIAVREWNPSSFEQTETGTRTTNTSGHRWLVARPGSFELQYTSRRDRGSGGAINTRDRKARTRGRFCGRNRQCIMHGVIYREPGIHLEPVNPNNATRTVFTDSHGRVSPKGEYLCARGGYPPVHTPPPYPLDRPYPNYGIYYWNGIITWDGHIIRLLCISLWRRNDYYICQTRTHYWFP